MRTAGYLSAIVLLGVGGQALAADNGVYLGAAIGRANAELETGFAPIDDDDTGYKIIAGIRPLDWLAVEASYVDFGEIEDGGFSTSNDGLSAFAIGFLPVGPIDLFAKGGLYRWDTSVDAEGLGRIASGDGTDLAYGVGAQFRFLSLGLRAEYEIFDIDAAEDLNMLSIGVTYTFL